ncbi:NAD(P)-binding domain-containing protein [Rhodococcus sp. P1Y]|uniref:NAD(P)-binding domain-containing protein n=1 Tax=Rhodococcus sp. P1Y TaxID=1302308 RepID=UPI00137A49B4|nr:NAD(P)-binding domain-containing protein [Rhodococcus sp. P1Y]
MTQVDERSKRDGHVVVVGLGGIGGGIAHRLVDRGRAVIGVDLDSKRADDWEVESGSTAVSSFDAVQWTSVGCVVVAVRTAAQVEAVLADVDISSALGRGATLFVVTTLTPNDAQRITAADLEGRRFEVPVSGGEVRARNGELTGLLAGPAPDAFESSLLAELFATVFTFEQAGHPSLVKLINNTLAAHSALNASVALQTAQEAGIDTGLAHQVIRASSGSTVAGDSLATLTENQVELLLKDVRLLEGELPRSPFTDASIDDVVEHVAIARTLLNEPDSKGTP